MASQKHLYSALDPAFTGTWEEGWLLKWKTMKRRLFLWKTTHSCLKKISDFICLWFTCEGKGKIIMERIEFLLSRKDFGERHSTLLTPFFNYLEWYLQFLQLKNLACFILKCKKKKKTSPLPLNILLLRIIKDLIEDSERHMEAAVPPREGRHPSCQWWSCEKLQNQTDENWNFPPMFWCHLECECWWLIWFVARFTQNSPPKKKTTDTNMRSVWPELAIQTMDSQRELRNHLVELLHSAEKKTTCSRWRSLWLSLN